MGIYLMADTLSMIGNGLFYSWIILQVLVGLGLVIFVHELGHFLVAKACGVKCEKFYIGFDVPIRLGPLRLPQTLGKFQWGETEYGIGIIPLGGYVKMLGQDDNPANAQKEAERIRVQKGASLEGEASAVPAGDAEGSQYELDPRSYPAKSVPQRMAIISAGVVMNLIFAVIFAAIAYGIGVKHDPCEIGGTAPGSPAWAENVPIGSKIVQIGRDGTESDHLRFLWDLRQQIALRGLGEAPKPLDLKLELPDGQREWVTLLPSDRLVKLGLAEHPTIGVRATDSTTLRTSAPPLPYLAIGRAEPPLEPGDRIVGVSGEPFPTERANETGEIPADRLEAELAANRTRELTLMVERHTAPASAETSPQRLEVTIPPQPLRTVGLEMRIGPIESVRRDSPAALAGLRVGDRIMAVRGQPVGDPLILPQRLEQWIGQEVTLAIERPEDEGVERLELAVTPEPRFQYAYHDGPSSGRSSLVAIESIGIAYGVENVVAAVESGSPAALAGLRAGDLLTQAQFDPVTEEAKGWVDEFFVRRVLNQPIEFDGKQRNWPYVFDLLQVLPPGTDLKLGYARGDEKLTATLKPIVSDTWFTMDRGFRFRPLERIHVAESWLAAWQLGLRGTKESLVQVTNFLGKLFTFRVSIKTLGGPLLIATAAGSEASQGLPRLLLFLTLLSANLAILNFLPIPALDGGHMVFLTAEAVTGRPVDERLQGTLTLIGVACLLGLMVFVFANDIGRLVM